MKRILSQSQQVEEYLKLEPGAFDHIPHYAREASLSAILEVRALEEESLFRLGLYYIVLADLCRSTETSLSLGTKLHTRRVETFILQCVDALGNIRLSNYSLFVREIGDAVLILFSSFEDVFAWWSTMEQWIAMSNQLWSIELTDEQYRHFMIEAKTVVHAGEVAYSEKKIPLSHAVNKTFKVEKVFSSGELGCTQVAREAAAPVMKSLGLHPRKRGEILLPGERLPTSTYLVAKSSWHDLQRKK